MIIDIDVKLLPSTFNVITIKLNNLIKTNNKQPLNIVFMAH